MNRIPQPAKLVSRASRVKHRDCMPPGYSESMRLVSDLQAAMRRALEAAADEPSAAERAVAAARILAVLAQANEDAGAIYRHAMTQMLGDGMSYAQVGNALGIARGTVQKHAEHSRRLGTAPGLIFAFRDEAGDWHPRPPEDLLPGGPYATGDGTTIPADRPSRFACEALVFAYEDEASGRIADDSPGYAYHVTNYGRLMRSTRAVHDSIWRAPAR